MAQSPSSKGSSSNKARGSSSGRAQAQAQKHRDVPASDKSYGRLGTGHSSLGNANDLAFVGSGFTDDDNYKVAAAHPHDRSDPLSGIYAHPASIGKAPVRSSTSQQQSFTWPNAPTNVIGTNLATAEPARNSLHARGTSRTKAWLNSSDSPRVLPSNGVIVGAGNIREPATASSKNGKAPKSEHRSLSTRSRAGD